MEINGVTDLEVLAARFPILTIKGKDLFFKKA